MLESLRTWIKLKFRRPSRGRVESNRWLLGVTGDITGSVLSVGSGNDMDGQGRRYRSYFRAASRYTTSEMANGFGTDLVIDVTRMPEVADGSYDCVFCSGVLEHVVDYLAALREMTRVLKPGGLLLLGVPFRQAIHNAPLDYWRFTEGGLRHLLRQDYEVLELAGINESVKGFPSAYWVKARKHATSDRV